MNIPDELIKKIQEKILDIQNLANDFGVKDFEYVFIGGRYEEVEGKDEFGSMDVLYSIRVHNEDSLDEYLSFVSNAYSNEERNILPDGDTSDINFWLNLGQNPEDIN